MIHLLALALTRQEKFFKEDEDNVPLSYHITVFWSHCTIMDIPNSTSCTQHHPGA